MTPAIRPAARQDILRQYRYDLVKEAFDAATRFMNAVEQSIEQLGKRPEIRFAQGNFRYCPNRIEVLPVKDFEEFRIYYLVRGDAVRVIRVLHGKRDLRKALSADRAVD